MATYVENLQAAREALAASLAANAGKPDVSFDGETISWGELFDRIAKLDTAIASGQGPVEVETQGLV
jgi:ABC-type glycerol-3-phosphate transport system substrate-binding protein